MAFKLPKKFSPGFSTTKKPTCPVEIDWSNPLTKKLVYVNLLDSGINLIRNDKVDLTANAKLTAKGLYLNGTDNWARAPEAVFDTDPNFSTVVSFTPESTDTWFPTIIARGDTGSGEWMLRWSIDDNSVRLYGDSGSLVVNSGINLITVGRQQTVASVKNGSSYWRVYHNGKSFGESASPPSINSAKDLQFGTGDSSDTREFKGYIHLVLGWEGRSLTDAEIKSISENPYQILKPSIDTIYFTDTTESPGGVDINVPKSDINLTSFQPAVNISQHITAEIPQHDLNLLSHTPSVTIGANIDVIAPQHDISINSYPPVVVTSESIDLDIPLHNININSHAPIAVASNFIDVDIPKSDININSHAPVISLGAIIENIIPAHNINITGYAPDVVISEHINSIIPEHNISLISYAPEVLANSSVNAIIPNNDIQIESHIPRILIAGAFTTAKERIYGYPAINRIYTMTRK